MSSKKETTGLEDSDEVVFRRFWPRREVLSFFASCQLFLIGLAWVAVGFGLGIQLTVTTA